MKQIVRLVFVNSASLFLVSLLLPGLKVSGGAESYIFGGAILAILTLILDPVVKIITLPFNMLTLGLLSFLTTLVSLFILTIVFGNISVLSFKFSGISFMGLQIKELYFPLFLSYVAISATIYILNKLVSWLFSK